MDELENHLLKAFSRELSHTLQSKNVSCFKVLSILSAILSRKTSLIFLY